MRIQCPACKAIVDAPTGKVNRAIKVGAPLYCGRVCAGIARRKGKSTDQRKAEKSEYDRLRRERLGEKIKAQKRAHFKATYDPVAAAAYRKKRMPIHVEYCRRPEYRAWKAEYDREYRAKKDFGEFWESAMLLASIDTEIAKKASRYEIMMTNGTINKAQRRRREYERSDR